MRNIYAKFNEEGTDGLIWSIGLDDREDYYFSNDKSITDNQSDLYINGECSDLIKSAYGIAMYISAFPDCIDDIKDGDLSQGRKVSVGKSNKMKTEREHSARSPHWRMGHFRTLRHERYGDSVGRTIWIDGTFVKGKAYKVTNKLTQEG